MAEIDKKDLDAAHQVIEYIGEDTVRIYNIVAAHEGDENDPLTTYEVAGYQDVPAYTPIGKAGQ